MGFSGVMWCYVAAELCRDSWSEAGIIYAQYYPVLLTAIIVSFVSGVDMIKRQTSIPCHYSVGPSCGQMSILSSAWFIRMKPGNDCYLH